MSNIETNLQNAFETTLSAEMSASDLTASVASIGSLTSPCYLVIDPDDDEKREYILFDGTFGASSFVTSTINNRYLAGSAYGSNIIHANGATVRMVPVAQHFEDLNDRIDNIDHGSITGLGDNDHPQYLLSATHAADDHSSLAIDADKLDGQHASYFATSTHNHDSDYAPDTHVGGDAATDHPLATQSSHGFMSSTDKTTLDNLESAGGGVSSVLAGTNIDVSGTSVVTVSHEDTSSVGNISLGVNEHMDGITFDGHGHVTGVSKQTMTPGDIGASPSGHDHAGTYAPASHTSSADHDSRYAAASHTSSGDHDGRYYTEGEVNSLISGRLPINNPSFTGTLKYSSVDALNMGSGFLKLYYGAGNDVLWGDGYDELYLGGVQYAGGAFAVEADENGVMRRIKYDTIASARRFKTDIEPTPLTGGECLKWDGSRFKYINEVEKFGDDATPRDWYIAEDILDASGEAFVKRDIDGEVLNTRDRAMLLDVIITLQDAVEEIGLLKQRIEELESRV